MSKKIAMLLSGGVDSSVAMTKLVQEGHRVEAFYLKIWLEDELQHLGDCPWEEDMKFATQVCEKLEVPLRAVPLQSEYWERVVSYTVAELKAGRTPSPDIFCNQRIKYGAFLDTLAGDYDYVASGHYAIVEHTPQGSFLRKGADPIKDQTYFLSHLSQKQLAKCLFPLGGMQKEAVRELAKQYDLPNQARADSQGICFLGKIKYPEFVKFHLGTKRGEIKVKDTGEAIGQHEGFWFHTIGQRKGLGLSGGPWFVVDKNTESNTVYVSHDDCFKTLAIDQFTIGNVHWIQDAPIPGKNYQCKVRHGAKTYECSIAANDESEYQVNISEKDSGIAPGQFCVVYDDETCLGGGVINL